MSIAQTLKTLRPVLKRYNGLGKYLPTLSILGFAGSFAETFGISLVMLLLAPLMGGNVGPGGAWLNRIYSVAIHVTGGSPLAIGGLICGLVLAKLLLGMIYGVVNSHMRHSISQTLREQLVESYLTMPYSRLREQQTGTLHDAVALHSWSVADTMSTLARIGANILSIAVFAVFIIAISPLAAFLAVVGSALIFLLTTAFGKKASVMGWKCVDTNADLTDSVLNMLQEMRTIRGFGREGWALRRYRGISRRARSQFQAIEILQMLIYPTTEIAYLLLLVAIAAASAFAGISATATFTVFLLLYRLQPSLRELDSNRLSLAGHTASIERVVSLLDTPVPPAEPPRTLGYGGLGEGIRFDQVSFGFDAGRPVLDKASFVIPSHGLTVLAGGSGAGKTTVVNLILGLYEPQAGQIFVGGVPMSAMKRAALLEHVAISGQDAELISGSIAENIRFGRLNARAETLWQVLALAGVDDVVERLPEGLHSRVGSRGLNLSGGQRQRISIARALCRDPDILILDEATNAVERALELEILGKIVADRPNKITIMISHREGDIWPGAHYIDVAHL